MLRPVLIIAALAVLAAAGVVEGLRTNRWGVSDDGREAVQRLLRVPRTVASWKSSENEIDQKILDRAEATGSVSRIYRDEKTGAALSVLLLCGPSGPIGAHTPDICYGGLGYRMVGREVKKTLVLTGGEVETYWSGRFDKTGEPGIEVCWAWGTDGDWVAAEAPRRDFLLRNTLYKLYVTRGLSPSEREGNVDSTTVQDFLKDFLPEVKQALASN